ncbi:phage tail tube protein [Sphingobium algorifonticola]|uniref:Phage tail protein n=1 Tax=Sphingobium algorifonticola TaxID=2008318 RepID=A0A437JBZ6_9SPHN|nr:phage tail protein [Sphingobium algorifonticola]RVT43427.1 phage tail protein [Sphingobium algorifonticola]
MAVENGSSFLLKVSDGAVPPGYETVAGLRTTQMSVSGEAVNITSKDSGGWRALLSGAGVRAVSVSAAGIFTGSAAEVRIRNHALAGTIDDFELSFDSGERMRGRFLVTRLDYAGDYNGERNYTVSLESSGPVVSL